MSKKYSPSSKVILTQNKDFKLLYMKAWEVNNEMTFHNHRASFLKGKGKGYVLFTHSLTQEILLKFRRQSLKEPLETVDDLFVKSKVRK